MLNLLIKRLDMSVLQNGEGEIRTHGYFRITRFQVERIRPLCHLSSEAVSSHLRLC